MNTYTCPHWTEDLVQLASEAETFGRIGEVGIMVMERMPRPIHFVCGPITTGGFGCPKKNGRIFQACIELLRDKRGLSVFNQMPLQEGMLRLFADWSKTNTGYCTPILEETYRTLFAPKLIEISHFQPRWPGSFGARWEREEFTRLGREIREYDPELFDEAIQRCGFSEALP